MVAELATGSVTAADAVTATYAAFSVVLLLVLRRHPLNPSTGRAIPAVDVAAAAALTVVAAQPLVHFFPLFALVSTAYRTGIRQTVASGLVMAAALALETHPAVEAVFGHPSIPSHIVVLGGYTIVLAVLIGHLANSERGARSESAAVHRVLERLRLDAGPVASLRSALGEIQSIFGARQVLLALEDTVDEVSVLWRTRLRGAGADRDPVVELIGESDRARYWFPVDPAGGAGAVYTRDHSPCLPDSFTAAHPATRTFVLPELAIGRFRGRVFLLDPLTDQRTEQLVLLRSLVLRTAPVVHNLFLERRVRTRLKENERVRLARELHDGVVQTLIGLEMRLDVARREVSSAPETAAADLLDIQQQLHEQVVDVRGMMDRLRPPDVDRRRLVECLSESTERFQRTTGIDARFVGTADRLDLPARVCGELVRVVDEALVNVRKHSGASRVHVHLAASGDDLTLSVEDDGRGFGFAGRMTQPDLDAMGLGPLVIKERVQAIGGRVAIDSRPGRGTRLEVQVPRPAHG